MLIKPVVPYSHMSFKVGRDQIISCFPINSVILPVNQETKIKAALKSSRGTRFENHNNIGVR
jgi:hypothetical protein